MLSALASGRHPAAGRVTKLAVERVPVCGTNEQVLAEHGLDGARVAAAVRERVRAAV